MLGLEPRTVTLTGCCAAYCATCQCVGQRPTKLLRVKSTQTTHRVFAGEARLEPTLAPHRARPRLVGSSAWIKGGLSASPLTGEGRVKTVCISEAPNGGRGLDENGAVAKRSYHLYKNVMTH